MSDPRALAQRIARLVGDIADEADPSVQTRVEELIRALMELYGDGLARVTALAAENGGVTLEQLAADEVVSSLLILHGLHPQPLAERVARAVEGLQRSLGSSLRLTVHSVSEAAVRLTLAGRDLGCAADGIRQTIERAIRDAAPEVQQVDLAIPPPPVHLLQIVRRSELVAPQ
jgi:hypothetical protein